MTKFKNSKQENQYFNLSTLKVLETKGLLTSEEAVSYFNLCSEESFYEIISKKIGGRKLSKLNTEITNEFILNCVCDEKEKEELMNFITSENKSENPNFELFLKMENEGEDEELTYSNKKVLVSIKNEQVKITI